MSNNQPVVDRITSEAKEIKELIENKNYEALEKYLTAKGPGECTWTKSWAGYFACYREGIMPFAVKLRDPEATKLLVNHKVHRYTDDKFTSDDRLFLAQFYDNDNDPTHEAKSYLLLAGVVEGNVQEIKYWHERNLYADLEQKMSQIIQNIGLPLLHCCKNGFNDCVEYLVKTVGHLPNQIIRLKSPWPEYNAPLLFALKYGQIGTADLLLSLGANANLEVDLRYNDMQTIAWPIGHHICRLDSPSTAYLVQVRDFQPREQSLKWLLEHGATDFLTKFPIQNEYGMDSFEIPPLIVAIKSRAVGLAKILLDLQRDHWTNKGGILFEMLMLPANMVGDDSNLVQELLDLVIPLVNPETRQEDLANVLAASIRFESLYTRLIEALGADLQYKTKPEKYHYSFGKSLYARLKLSQNGAEVLIEENEDHELSVERISISTRTSKIPMIRKKMGIPDSSPVFFEWDGLRSDPEKSLWEAITGYKTPNDIQHRDIRLLDKQSGKIYVGNQHVVQFIFGIYPRHFIDPNEEFWQRFAIFASILPEDLQVFSFPKQSRIMIKSDQAKGSVKSDAKRSFDQIEDKTEDQQPAKRRKTRK